MPSGRSLLLCRTVQAPSYPRCILRLLGKKRETELTFLTNKGRVVDSCGLLMKQVGYSTSANHVGHFLAFFVCLFVCLFGTYFSVA